MPSRSRLALRPPLRLACLLALVTVPMGCEEPTPPEESEADPVAVAPQLAEQATQFSSQNVIVSGLANAQDVHAVDLNGDGSPDPASASGDGVSWYENDGSASFTARSVFTTPSATVHAGDVDGDGDADPVSSPAFDVSWYENDGSGSFTAHSVSSGEDAADVHVADLNGDGALDVAAATSNDEIVWYENDGSGGFTRHLVFSDVDAPEDVRSADVDGDGDADLLSASRHDGKIVWYENDGTGGFTADVLTSRQNEVDGDQANFYAVDAGDVDGDGDVDLAAADFFNHRIIWFENDGAEAFTARTIGPSVLRARDVHVLDVDGDGDRDFVAARDDQVAWYENDGSQAFAERIVTSAAEGAKDVHPADLDGDGDADLLSASFSHGKVAWYENNANQGVSDADGDGIDDEVDLQPGTFSSDFDDGTAEGSIVDRGDQTVFVQVDPDGGLIVSTEAGGGAAEASVEVRCGSETTTYTLGADEAMTVACGNSVQTRVERGSIEVVFVADDGTTSTTTVDSGNTLTYDGETNEFSTSEENEDTIVIESGGTERALDPGQRVIVVALSLRAGGEGNTLNARSRMTLPLAVLSTPGFDATRIDPATVEVGPAGASPRHPGGHETDLDGDDRPDLLLHVRLRDTGIGRDATKLCLSGDTDEGAEVNGCAEVRVAR